MSTPHKHAVELRAIAEGDAVESRRIGSFAWYALNNLSVLDDDDYEHRIKPHRWQECKDAQAAGKAVQGRFVGAKSWLDQTVWDFDQLNGEFRIKPETMRYRIALMRAPNGGQYTVTADDESELEIAEGLSEFVKWVGDWQEVEA